jgi:heme exporter protein B
MTTLKQIKGVFSKDLKSEIRTRYSISAILLFILVTITMVVFALIGEKLNESITAGLLWIIMFFAAMTGLDKTFVSEEERGTSLILKLSTTSTAVFFGKLLYNVVLALVLNFVAIFIFSIIVNSTEIKSIGIFAATMFVGSIGLASATTIISAIIARANTKGAMFPILSFPILLPLIMLGIDNTRQSLEGTTWVEVSSNLQMMFAYCGAVIPISFILFDIVWKE